MNPPNSSRPPRRPSLLPLVVLACLAFWLSTQYRRVSAQRGGQADDVAAQPAMPGLPAPKAPSNVVLPKIVIPDFSNDGPTQQSADDSDDANQPAAADPAWARPGAAANGDWAVDMDLPSTKATDATANADSDWSMETRPSSPATGNAGSPKPKPPTSTVNGDWSMGEQPSVAP